MIKHNATILGAISGQLDNSSALPLDEVSELLISEQQLYFTPALTTEQHEARLSLNRKV